MNKSFLSKKSWHTGSVKSMEKVWKAEQAKIAEDKRMKELQRELKKQNQYDELISARDGMAGVSAQRLEWMYRGQSVGTTSEEYLQGKMFESEEDKEDTTTPALFQQKGMSSEQDARAKINEDPLLAIKRRELESLKRIKDNPLLMKKLKKQVAKEKKKKKKKKKNKHKRNHSNDNDESDRVEHSRSSSSSTYSRDERRTRTRRRSRNRSRSNSPPHASRRYSRDEKESRSRRSRSRSTSPRHYRDRSKDRSSDRYHKSNRSYRNDQRSDRETTYNRENDKRSSSRKSPTHDEDNRSTSSASTSTTGNKKEIKIEQIDSGDEINKTKPNNSASNNPNEIDVQSLKSKGYGLILPKGKLPSNIPAKRKRTDNDDNNNDNNDNDDSNNPSKRQKSSNFKQPVKPTRRRYKPLSEEEQQKKLQEMQQDANKHIELRVNRLEKDKLKQIKEEEEFKNRAKNNNNGNGNDDDDGDVNNDPQFLKQLNRQVYTNSKETLEDKIRRNAFTRQKSNEETGFV